MKVTVIIPNYNGLRFLKDCLTALENQSMKDFETLVIDNASSDESVTYIRENFPNVNVMVMEKNLGFSGGVNVGIQSAKTPYVLLLNNDTEVDTHFVEEMVHAIEESPNIFSVSSKMIQFYDREKLDDAGDLYGILGWGFQRGIDAPATSYTKKEEIFSACAGAAIYRKDVFEKIGYFDELHFAYLEDIDVGYRGKIAGYKNMYCPTAIVYHVGSGTSGSKYNSFKVKLAARNSVYLNYKNMPNIQLVINSLPLCLGWFLKWRFFKKNGFEKDYVDGLKEGFSTRKKCKRVQFQWKNWKNYVKIEWQLIKNMWIYCIEFGKRKIK